VLCGSVQAVIGQSSYLSPVEGTGSGSGGAGRDRDLNLMKKL